MARKGEPPAFQLYATDWVAETATLNATARGVLSTLRAHAWIHRRLPLAEIELARLGGVTRAEMRKIWPAISHWFETPPEGGPYLVEPQLELQREALEKHRKGQANKAKKRWDLERDPEGARADNVSELHPRGDAAALPVHMPDGCSPFPSSFPDPPQPPANNSHFSDDVGDRLKVDMVALKELWRAKTGLRGEFVAGLPLAAARIEEYALVCGRDAMAIAELALDAFNRYCDTRSIGYRPEKNGYKFVEHWGKIEPVVEGRGTIEAAPQRAGTGPTIIAGLDYSKKERS